MGIVRRTKRCGEFRIEDVGEKARINGWVRRRRDLGALIFCDIGDKTGSVQVVFDDTLPEEVLCIARELRTEYTVGIEGRVRERESKNDKMETGDIEIIAESIVIYSKAETPPIYIKDDDNVAEELRLKYRYLDLRKQRMQRNLSFRHKLAKVTRDFFDREGFVEVETPFLIKPTPEGARDYLVPSRVNPGKFYALPQSPQIFKQILMVGGTDRYFQIARCFRDEDLRADRQPEFTQVDVEMSFVDREAVLEVQERYVQTVFKELLNVDIALPLPRLSYKEAMERFGSDKPDLRFGFELKGLEDVFADTEFKVFSDVLRSGGRIMGINIEGGSPRFGRKAVDKLADSVRVFGCKGVSWIRFEEGETNSSIAKFCTEETYARIAEVFGAKAGDLILIAAGEDKVVYDSLGFLRRDIADKLGLLKPDDYRLLWVLDFPLLEYNEEDGRFYAMHHPFTSPKAEDAHLLDSDPGAALANAYDIVMNGVELGGGSIRIHDRELQEKMFEVLGFTKEETEGKFGYLLEAFKYGTPPHGGIAYGFDRLAMLLLGESSIREVIAFPKNQNAVCPMSQAPGTASRDQLDELAISVKED